jgi:hypothetical protein
MRRSNGPSPFNLASTDEERDRQKTHKRKRSNDASNDEDNKRTKLDKHPANNNVPPTTTSKSSVETVDLAASEKGGVSYHNISSVCEFNCINLLIL